MRNLEEDEIINFVEDRIQEVLKSRDIQSEIKRVAKELKFTENQFRELDCLQELEIFDKVKTQFLAMKQSWFWQDLKYPYTSARFKGRQGSQQLSQIVPNAYELVWFLVNEPKLSYWPVYEAMTVSIEKIVVECNIFQYCIIAKDFSWLIGENDYHLVFAIGKEVEKNLKEFETDLFAMMNWDKEDITPLSVLAELLNETHQPIMTIKGFGEVLLKLNYSSEEERLSDTKIILESAIFLENMMEAVRKYLTEYHNQSDG